MDALTLTPDQAHAIVAEWEADHDDGACEFFRPGSFDLDYGEHRCHRCGVPEQTHRAYRLLNKAVLTHG